jgi:hypothetical protein
MNQNMTITENMAGICSIHQLEEVLEYLDALHTAACENQSVLSVDHAEALELLREIVFTAREAIREIERERAERQAHPRTALLRIVEKVDRAG